MMHNIKSLFRLNHIRNHYIRYGLKGIGFYFKLVFNRKAQNIVFKCKEYRHPVTLRNNSSDIEVFYQVLFNNSYQIKPETDPLIIIDLGANIGLSSVYFLNKFQGSSIIAVEPDRDNFEMLMKNTSGYPNFRAYNNGIWNRNAFLEIKDNNLGSWGFSVFETDQSAPTAIEAITIDQIVSDNGISKIDILKIDIEGAEIELFRDNFEKWMPITRVIIIELHDWMREGCAKQFFAALLKYKFTYSQKGENIICFLNE